MNQFHLFALIAGLLLPLQIAFNNKLTLFSGNPTTSSLISFSVGTIALVVYSLTNPTAFQKSLQQLSQAPLYAWLGGLVGAFYIISSIVASPKIGIATFLTLIIGGQLAMSLVVEHFGWLGIAVKSITWAKILGLLLVLVGIVLIKK